MSASLCLHAGANAVTRTQVLDYPTPEATDTHQPVPHGVLIDGLLSRLGRAGLTVTKEQHGIARQGARWFGVFDLATAVEGREYCLALGLRNAHDKSFAASIVMGSRVFVCDNLAMSGEVQFTRKHTNQILLDLPEIMDEAMVGLSKLEVFMHARIQHYQRTEMADRDVSDFVIRTVMDGILPVTRLKAVVGEWKRPTHEEFQPRTAWSLFNAFTEVYKQTAFTLLPTRTQRLHLLLDRFVGAPKFAEITDGVAPQVEIGDLGNLGVQAQERIQRAEKAEEN